MLLEAWKLRIRWDDPLPEKIRKKFESWLEELCMLDKVEIARCLQPKDFTDRHLHVFVDASSKAYGAVAYLRYEYEDTKPTIIFVAAKTRVAPLEPPSIPKLELMAARLGARMTKTIAETLQISNKNLVFWSDYMDVFYWIKNDKKNHTQFVTEYPKFALPRKELSGDIFLET